MSKQQALCRMCGKRCGMGTKRYEGRAPAGMWTTLAYPPKRWICGPCVREQAEKSARPMTATEQEISDEIGEIFG